jgi:uncharacterized protein (TIGR01244 family)
MKSLSIHFSILLLLIAAFGTSTIDAAEVLAVSKVQKAPSLPLLVSESVTLAGELTEAQISTFNHQTLVIDLRTAEEGSQAEAEMLGAANIRYVNIPMSRKPLNKKTVDQFSKLILDNANSKVLVHCSSGNRAGLLWAAHLINQGTNVDKALTLVRPIATKEGTRKAIRLYAEKKND